MAGAPVILLTDRAWPDDSVERGVVEAARFELVAGPAEPAPPEVVEGLIREHRPAAVLTCWAPVSARAIRSSVRCGTRRPRHRARGARGSS
jgi:D-3-phosphoglycerate dehydrogenase